MEDNEQYEVRYFDTRTGDVGLTCCKRCGSIVWNPDLHERAEHGNNESTGQDLKFQTGTGQDNDEQQVSTNVGQIESIEGEKLSGTGGSAIGVSGGTATPRPVSSPPARGTGRTTAAGSGKQARR